MKRSRSSPDHPIATTDRGEYSGKIFDFARPWLEMAPIDAHESILQLAIGIWNAVTVDGWQGGTHHVDAQIAGLAADPEPGRSFMLSVLREMARRKRERFGAETWGVGDWSVRRTPDGDLRLRVVAREGHGERPVRRSP